eukprot:5315514-Alexandrium_andersonii.AAC.1
MSASLVGSEMCIRDSPTAQQPMRNDHIPNAQQSDGPQGMRQQLKQDHFMPHAFAFATTMEG